MSLYNMRPCKYNHDVQCRSQCRCINCGWEPTTDELRRERLRELANAGKLVDRDLKKRSCL